LPPRLYGATREAFKAHNGEFLAAEEGHLYTLGVLGDKCKFHIEEHDGGKKVSLKTHNGHFVAVNSNSEIYLAKSHSSDECKFALENHHGRVALKSHHGGYLGVRDGKVHVHEDRTDDELFEEASF